MKEPTWRELYFQQKGLLDRYIKSYAKLQKQYLNLLEQRNELKDKLYEANRSKTK